MIFLLHDDFWGPERLAELRKSYANLEFLELNTTVLDGQKLTVRDMAEACEAMPFLSERRMVIVRRLASRFETKRQESESGGAHSRKDNSRKAEAEQFCSYFAEVPPTTDLVLLEPGKLQDGNPILKCVRERNGEVVGPRVFRDGELEHWITERVRAKGGRISSEAVAMLATYLGPQLRTLDSELEKLVVYAAGEVITEGDVGLLVNSAREGNVFAMVDALGMRNGKSALRLLHDLLDEGEPPQRLMAMVIRQFRMLLQIGEMQVSGRSRQDIASELRLNPYVVPKMITQAGRFTTRQLESIYGRLVETDLALKTSRIDPKLALDTVFVDLTKG